MFKYSYIFILLFVSQPILIGQVFDVEVLLSNGDNDKRINFVYMGDGYTDTQQTVFMNDAQSAVDAQFNFTPYKEYKNFFNAYAIEVISNEEGVDHPGTATDVVEPVFPVSDVDTYFDCTFDYYNIHRLLAPQDYTAILDVLVANTPFYDQANIIVNSPYYGGSGGGYATASTHTDANKIMIHEIGHSFVDLNDEYWPGSIYAEEKANMTQENTAAQVKWKNWIGDESIGIYPYGSTPPQSEWFRPHQSCMMRQLNGQFCAVCREATIDRIYTLVNPIESFFPEETTVSFDGEELSFSVGLILPDPNTLETEWFIDDVSFATAVDNITLTNAEITAENHVVKVNVEDVTTLSRTYTFASGYLFSVTWNIDNTLLSAENNVQKFLYKVYPSPTENQLFFNYTAEHIQETFTLLISDIQGKKIRQKVFTPQDGTHQFSIDVSSLQSGLYILNIKASSYARSFKFIKG